jgi:two-component system, OmpR family, alkaline phosphatase synthesis response regulator PhoP
LKKKILAIDDSEDIRMLLRHILKEDYELVTEATGEYGLKSALVYKPDLIILDLGLPEMDGFELCNRFRSLPDLEEVPIIILSGQKGPEVHTKAYTLGADNFVEKPFNHDELLALIKSKLRLGGSTTRKNLGEVTIDLKKGSAYYRGDKVDLTPKEFKILAVLSLKVGEVTTREEIFKKVWEKTHVSDRVIDNHVTALRKKMMNTGILIESIYAEGYKISIIGQ